MKEPDVYIGQVRDDEPWGTDESPDNDTLDTAPVEVVQILGFDPMRED